MAFSSINRQFPTVADFTAYLGTLTAPDWAKGSVVHNTYIPNESRWMGYASMVSIQRTYTAKGWTSGPHVFLALGCPRKADEGIWVMTPPTRPGTHAGACNSSRFGIELVGDFNSKAPSLPQQKLLMDTLVALHSWAGLEAHVLAHRDCMAGRTCPGDAFYALMPQIRAELTRRLNGAGWYIARHTQAVFEAPHPASPVALGDTARIVEGERIEIDEVRPDGWAHLAKATGFVPSSVLTKVTTP